MHLTAVSLLRHPVYIRLSVYNKSKYSTYYICISGLYIDTDIDMRVHTRHSILYLRIY